MFEKNGRFRVWFVPIHFTWYYLWNSSIVQNSFVNFAQWRRGIARWGIQIAVKKGCNISRKRSGMKLNILMKISISKKSQSFCNILKLVSTIFYQIFIFHQMIALWKLWKVLSISSEKVFLFSRYSNFCIFVSPSFFCCQPLLERLIQQKS